MVDTLCDRYSISVYHFHNLYGSSPVGVGQVLAIVYGGSKEQQLPTIAPRWTLQCCDSFSDLLFRCHSGDIDFSMHRVNIRVQEAFANELVKRRMPMTRTFDCVFVVAGGKPGLLRIRG